MRANHLLQFVFLLNSYSRMYTVQLQLQQNGRLVAWLVGRNCCLFLFFNILSLYYNVCIQIHVRRTFLAQKFISIVCNFHPIISKNFHHHHLNIQHFFQFALSFTLASTTICCCRLMSNHSVINETYDDDEDDDVFAYKISTLTPTHTGGFSTK